MRAPSRGRYTLLLNPDVICLPGLLDRLVEFMDRHPEASIAAPQLLNEDGTRQPNCRHFPTPGTLALRALRADEIWKTQHVRRYLMEDEPVRSGSVDWVTGAVMVARRAAIEAVGLLDERYFLYWEDMDWCYRMRRAGWGVFLVPEARAIHLHQREGVRRPLSRAGRAQLLGAARFFRKFGWNPGRWPEWLRRSHSRKPHCAPRSLSAPCWASVPGPRDLVHAAGGRRPRNFPGARFCDRGVPLDSSRRRPAELPRILGIARPSRFGLRRARLAYVRRDGHG